MELKHANSLLCSFWYLQPVPRSLSNHVMPSLMHHEYAGFPSNKSDKKLAVRISEFHSHLSDVQETKVFWSFLSSFSIVLWPQCLSSVIKLSQMSCPLTHWSLWFSLWTVFFGIWRLLQTSCAGEWKPTEPSRHVSKFRSWPLKWQFPWESARVMSDMRSYCCSGRQAAGEATLHFSAAKRGEFPSETYSQHHIVYLVREWCKRAERGYVRIYMLALMALAAIPAQSVQQK